MTRQSKSEDHMEGSEDLSVDKLREVMSVLEGTKSEFWRITPDAEESRNCDVCGMPYESSFPRIGLEWSTKWLSEAEADWVRDRAKPYRVDRSYWICFPCLLRAFGVRPEEASRD